MDTRVFAVAVGEVTPQSTLNLGLTTLYREQPDGRREQRYRFDLGGLERIRNWLRWESRFSLARDERPKSGAVQVQDHVYEIYTGLRLTYPYLFRYGFGFGPLLIWEETLLRVNADGRSKGRFTRWQVGHLAQVSVDYAFSTNWELTAFFNWISRPTSDKTDLAFGLAMSVNNSIWNAGKSASTGNPRSPSPAAAKAPPLP
jgi:hypothetical protein